MICTPFFRTFLSLNRSFLFFLPALYRVSNQREHVVMKLTKRRHRRDALRGKVLSWSDRRHPEHHGVEAYIFHWQFHHNFIIPNWHTEALVWQGKSGRIILNLLCKKFFGQISVQYIGVIPSRSKPDCWIRIMGHQLKAFDVDCWLVQSICSCFCTLVSRKSAWNLGSSQAVHTDLLKVMGTFSRLSGHPVHPSLIGKLMNMISVNDVEVGRLKMLPVWWAHKRCRDLVNFFQRFQNHRIEPLSSLTSLDVW